MEHPNMDGTPGLGRGRPLENSRLRRPHTTYATDIEYIPAEGSNNLLRMTAVDGQTFDMSPLADHPMFIVPTGDHMHVHPGVIHIASPNNSVAAEKKSVLSPHAPVFVPRNFRPEPPQINASMDPNLDTYPIQELRNFLCEITMNPGMFESKIQPLIDCFNEHVSDVETLRAIVNIIFDESVLQPNFRYSGARLCKSLCNELHFSHDHINFKQLLLHRCSIEHDRKLRLVESDDGGAYLRGFAMYVAELLSQVEQVPNQRIPFFAESLTSIIQTLLQFCSSDNLKCICQILKLVGAYLDDMEHSKGRSNRSEDELEKVMASLKIIAKNEEYPRDIRAMVNNVVELRSSDWGRADNDPVIEEYSPPTSLNEPVMYGPDGKPITAEESQFLHTQYSFHASDAEEYDGYDDNGDEMGEEIQAAYEEFLNGMNQ